MDAVDWVFGPSSLANITYHAFISPWLFIFESIFLSNVAKLLYYTFQA